MANMSQLKAALAGAILTIAGCGKADPGVTPERAPAATANDLSGGTLPMRSTALEAAANVETPKVGYFGPAGSDALVARETFVGRVRELENYLQSSEFTQRLERAKQLPQFKGHDFDKDLKTFNRLLYRWTRIANYCESPNCDEGYNPDYLSNPDTTPYRGGRADSPGWGAMMSLIAVQGRTSMWPTDFPLGRLQQVP